MFQVKHTIKCKSCSKYYSNLLLHLNKYEKCRECHSPEEFQELKNLAMLKRQQNKERNKQRKKRFESDAAFKAQKQNMIDKEIQTNVKENDLNDKVLPSIKVKTVQKSPDIRDLTNGCKKNQPEEISTYEQIREDNIAALKKKWNDINEMSIDEKTKSDPSMNSQ